MITTANLIIKVSRDDDVGPEVLATALRSEMHGLLDGRTLTRAADNLPTSHITTVEDVWVGGPHGGPFPTILQADEVKRLREEHGPESVLLFSIDAYEDTHLHAYGLVAMLWYAPHHGAGAGAPKVVRQHSIHPNGALLRFESTSI